MVKLSELRTADEIRDQDMHDLDYRREHERTRIANDVAIKVIDYRVRHGLSQSQLAAMLGMRQPHVARLEAGDHEPSVATLSRLADALNLDFSIEVKRNRVRLRHPARSEAERRRA
jgi:ribosome-binding protein aMBF1 (putative translation factor)